MQHIKTILFLAIFSTLIPAPSFGEMPPEIEAALDLPQKATIATLRSPLVHEELKRQRYNKDTGCTECAYTLCEVTPRARGNNHVDVKLLYCAKLENGSLMFWSPRVRVEFLGGKPEKVYFLDK